MPLINFQSWLVPKILGRLKPHTIRAMRKRPFKVGDRLCMYTGPRMKPRKIAEATCTAVNTITIADSRVGAVTMTVIRLDGGEPLEPVDQNLLALADGFSDIKQMMIWFRRTHDLPFSGQLIHWDPNELTLPDES